MRSRARVLVQDGVQDGAGGRAVPLAGPTAPERWRPGVPPAGPRLTLWAREGGDARGGPLAPKVLLQRLARLPSGSRVRARGPPPLGSLWFSCPSGSLRLFPTSLSGSICGDSPASYEVTGGNTTWWVCSAHDRPPVCGGKRASLEKTPVAPEWGSADKPARGLPALSSVSARVPGDNNRGATKQCPVGKWDRETGLSRLVYHKTPQARRSFIRGPSKGRGVSQGPGTMQFFSKGHYSGKYILGEM